MDVLRTPDDRLADLDGYPFEPNYVEITADPTGSGTDRATLRMHYRDEGDPDPDGGAMASAWSPPAGCHRRRSRLVVGS